MCRRGRASYPLNPYRLGESQRASIQGGPCTPSFEYTWTLTWHPNDMDSPTMTTCDWFILQSTTYRTALIRLGSQSYRLFVVLVNISY